MTTLVVVTAALFAVVLIVGLVGVTVFLAQIRRLMADTSSALEAVDAGAARLASRLQRLQRATTDAAHQLPTTET